MKHLRYSHCLVGLAIAVVLVLALGVSASTLGVLAVVLACPLMMFVMMRAMGDTRSSTLRDESSDDASRR